MRKVLKLRWDTKEDEICVDVKLNYGEKLKGAYLEEDAPLTDSESVLPSLVTWRILWRVAQSQCDPLGLLSVNPGGGNGGGPGPQGGEQDKQLISSR